MWQASRPLTTYAGQTLPGAKPLRAALRLPRPMAAVVAGFFLLLNLGGCTGDTSGNDTPTNNLPHFNDILTAPAAIRSAEKAVVRVGTAGESATGSFISPTGLLMTNSHVLGEEVCAVEGCYLEITSQWQAGEPYHDPKTVFAVPKTANAGLDLAVVQLYESKNGAMLSTPDYLRFNSQSPTALVGRHVTIVGHPEGMLKKWTDGRVARSSGQWFTSTAYILPGDSGSPVLDDAGQIVGLIHRGSSGNDLFTANGANVYSVGTASAPIMAALNAPLPAGIVSTAAPTTKAKFLDRNLVYLNARVSTVVADGVSTSALTLLGQACDAALTQNDFTTIDDLETALQPCYDAQMWIECRSDATASAYGTVCPGGSDIPVWTSRFKSVNQRWVDTNGAMEPYSVSYAIAHLQGTKSLGIAAGAQALQQALAQASPQLDFRLARYLAAFKISSYGGRNVKDYVVNYSNVPDYQLQEQDIASAAAWLYSNYSLSYLEFSSLATRLHDDPTTSVGGQLYIENLKHQIGL